MVPMVSPKFMDTRDAAIYPGWSASFLRKARMNGNLPSQTPGPPYYRVRQKGLYKIEDLDAWMENHRVDR